MLCLNTLADVVSAISDPDLDADLRRLIARRGWQIYAPQASPRRAATRIVVIQGGDSPDVINTSLGWAITGDDGEEPRYDTLNEHGLWFEIVYGWRSGRDTVIFVENGPDTELGIHYFCLAHFWTEAVGR